MLDTNKDYTAVTSFELRANTMTRTIITTPPEACTKGAGTNASFFRFRLVSKRVMCQRIDWADIDTPAKWTNASNAFTDLLSVDVDQWDVCQLSSTQILLIVQKTGENYSRHKVYTDGGGWAADAQQGFTATPAMALYAVANYGHVDVNLASGNPNQLYFRKEIADVHIAQYVLGDPGITRAYGWYSKAPMLMTYNASGELRIYDPLSYTSGAAYTWHLKYGRPAGSDIALSIAGDTIFCLENGVISQGYNPFYLRTIYSYTEMPCAKHAGTYYTHQGTRYSLANTLLGYIKEFSQDWKTFKCFVPTLANAYAEPCTVYLRRNYVDGSTIDSNPMLVDHADTSLFGTTFQCWKVIDSPAYSPLLHRVAESQPHLLFTHSLPYSPVAVNNSGSSIYNLLERYKLVLSHDLGQLLVKTNASPMGTLTYDLYTTDLAPARAVNLIYIKDTLARVPDLIAGSQPTLTHQVGFITANVARTTILKDYSFGYKRMTFEKPPQYFQIGDVVTIDSQAGMLDDIKETFSAAKWRQTLTALVA